MPLFSHTASSIILKYQSPLHLILYSLMFSFWFWTSHSFPLSAFHHESHLCWVATHCLCSRIHSHIQCQTPYCYSARESRINLWYNPYEANEDPWPKYTCLSPVFLEFTTHIILLQCLPYLVSEELPCAVTLSVSVFKNVSGAASVRGPNPNLESASEEGLSFKPKAVSVRGLKPSLHRRKAGASSPEHQESPELQTWEQGVITGWNNSSGFRQWPPETISRSSSGKAHPCPSQHPPPFLCWRYPATTLTTRPSGLHL